jgi:hypothetical protein
MSDYAALCTLIGFQWKVNAVEFYLKRDRLAYWAMPHLVAPYLCGAAVALPNSPPWQNVAWN